MPATPSSTRRGKKTKVVEREVIYAEPRAEVETITFEDAKEKLGWEVEQDGDEWDEDYLLLDTAGHKVRCSNNWNNRPFSLALCQTYKQEFLRKRWRLNGENLIIGQTGVCLSAQHRLIGFVLACEEYEADPEAYAEFWDSLPEYTTFVAYGISEDDETVNTIDVGKRRSFSDVAARSDLFASLSPRDRKAAARMLEHAVKLLWFRTGAKADAYAPVRTHAESWEFVQKHKHLITAVKHVLSENENRAVERFLSPGYASALLYLMGTSATPSDQYAETRSEQSADFSHWGKAEEFFTLLASDNQALAAVRKELSNLMNEGIADLDVKLSLLVRAWERFLSGKKITADSIELLFEKDSDGIRTLASVPYLGGLDVGIDAEAVVEGDEIEEAEVSEEQVQAEAAEIRKANLKKMAAEKRKGAAATNGREVQVDDEIYVMPTKKNEGAWRGTVVEILPKRGGSGKRMARVKVANGQAGAGSTYEVEYAQLQHHAPVE